MATSTAITALDNLIREELPATIEESLPMIAPTYKYIKQTSLGVQRNDNGIGRGWEVIHLFGTGVAGLIQNANPAGPAFEDNAEYYPGRILSGTDLTPFPSASAAPHAGTLKRTLSLHMSTGNFSVPVTWLQADQLSASQIEQVVRDIKAVGDLRAQTEAISFFMNSNNVLCQIDNLSTAGTSYLTFTVKSGTGRTAYFRPGMMVDILADSTGTPQFGTATDGSDRRNYASTYYPLIVSDVDYIGGTITVASIDNTNISGLSIADDDHVILRDCNTASREMRTWGLEDWIKSSGQILGGAATAQALDLDTYSQFKSQVKAVNGPLTDTVMNSYIGGFLDAYPGNSLDTIITTMGVTLKYLEQPTLYNQRMFYDRQGKALDVHGGWDDVKFSFNGRSFNWLISPLCMSGRLYATKFAGGNVRRYVPPRIGGTDSRVGSEVEFLAPLGGHANIFMVGRSSAGAPQAMLEAPFWQYCLIAPMDVKSVKLTGLTEATMS